MSDRTKLGIPTPRAPQNQRAKWGRTLDGRPKKAPDQGVYRRRFLKTRRRRLEER